MVSTTKASLLFLATYLVVSILAFGHVFLATYVIFPSSVHLPETIWIPSAFAGGTVAAIVCYGLHKIRKTPLIFIPSIFLVIFVLVTLFLLSIVTTKIRDDKIKMLQPDRLKTSSFLTSIPRGKEAVNGYSWSPHVAAIKDCEPYFWSYRDMELYKLSPNIAVNVFPREWVKECNIKRTTN